MFSRLRSFPANSISIDQTTHIKLDAGSVQT